MSYGKREAVSLEWVVVDGQPARVSVYAHLKPRQRPPAFCPECGTAVTLKLGRRRRHHAAHPPDSACAATRPETALHINTKLHLAATLSGCIGSGMALRVRRQCLVGNVGFGEYASSPDIDWNEIGAPRCPESSEETWLERWDEVRVEVGVGSGVDRRVPDIVLLDAGRVAGAIEVLVTHAIDEDKAAALASLGVKWVEVRGAESLYAGKDRWTADSPLRLARRSDGGRWRCGAHELAHETAREVRRRSAVHEPEPARSVATVIAARLVDVYHPGGSRVRLRFAVLSEIAGGGSPWRISLVRETRRIAAYLAVEGESGAQFQSRASTLAQRDYEADLKQRSKGRGVIVDSPMRWAKGAGAAELRHSSRQHPPRFRFSTQEQRWEPSPGMKGRRWPVTSAPGERPEDDVRDVHRQIEEAVRGRPRSGRSASVQYSLTPLPRRDTT